MTEQIDEWTVKVRRGESVSKRGLRRRCYSGRVRLLSYLFHGCEYCRRHWRNMSIPHPRPGPMRKSIEDPVCVVHCSLVLRHCRLVIPKRRPQVIPDAGCWYPRKVFLELHVFPALKTVHNEWELIHGHTLPIYRAEWTEYFWRRWGCPVATTRWSELKWGSVATSGGIMAHVPLHSSASSKTYRLLPCQRSVDPSSIVILYCDTTPHCSHKLEAANAIQNSLYRGCERMHLRYLLALVV